jgi:hypothetical protein
MSMGRKGRSFIMITPPIEAFLLGAARSSGKTVDVLLKEALELIGCGQTGAHSTVSWAPSRRDCEWDGESFPETPGQAHH